MEINTLTEEEKTAILSPEPPKGPSQENLLRQLESDYLVAQRNENSELMAELDERHHRVKAANSDEAALAAYEYREPEPEPDDVSDQDN